MSLSRSEEGAALLAVQALRCERGAALLFENLAFELNAGEALLVLGPNGSGKTSLLRLLAGLASPAGGTISWRGTIRARGAAAPRDEMLYLGHTVPLKDELSVLENLTQLLAFDGVRWERSGLLETLARVGLVERRAVAARHLSLGQRRRLGLARVLLARRTLWLLDEPATGLDQAGVELLEAALAGHLDSGGLAVLSSHQPLRVPGPARSLNL